VAKTWYPVIDYTLCAECGSCIKKCTHGVYNKTKAPVPVVEKPEACIDHCHGCGNVCPSGAITYLGDDTGWTPPHGRPAVREDDCGCGCDRSTACANDNANGCACGGNASALKTVAIDYLYLDLSSCDRCIGTDQALDEVVAAITPSLELAGYQVEYRKTGMTTAEIAKRYQFLSSPTIRVNGRDIAASVAENHCGCCSDISNSDVDCRVFAYEGKNYEVPPKQMLAEGILRVVFGEAPAADAKKQYTLPDNLRVFYLGKTGKSCECGGDCSK
jgi:NAD-dependent dihydropyrimidine dehydrogenase PreA subunit